MALRQARETSTASTSTSTSSRSPTASSKRAAETIAFFERRCCRSAGRPCAALGITRTTPRRLSRSRARVLRLLPFRRRVRGPGGRAAAAAACRHSDRARATELRPRVTVPPAEAAPVVDRLRPFADSTYLHQVVERRGRTSSGTIPISTRRSRLARSRQRTASGASTSTCRCSPPSTMASGPRRIRHA